MTAARDLEPVAEVVDDPAIEVALERDDQLREPLGLDPAPFAELGVLGRDVYVLVAPVEAGEKPVLVLADPFATPAP